MGEPDARDPGGPRDRESAQESQSQVRHLLMEWDPLGVSDLPEAADEYDCLIGPLLRRLSDDADTRSLAQWISSERFRRFGVAADEARDTRLAEALIAWWVRRRATLAWWPAQPVSGM